jgi:hypothetical protein
MTLTYVTAFYDISNKFRSSEKYMELLEHLLQTGVNILCYLDTKLLEKGKELCEKYPNLKIPCYVSLDTSWIPEDVILPYKRNEEKDTKEYFAVQLQKVWCLADAAKRTKTTHLAWIDAGIFHMFEDDSALKDTLHEIASAEWPSKIFVAGAWTEEDVALHYKLNEWAHLLDIVLWRFLGGFMLGPRLSWQEVLEKQNAIVKENLPHLGWEVNYWSKMDVFTWYQALHDLSMFKNCMNYRLLKPTPPPRSNIVFVTSFYAIPNKFHSLDFYLHNLEKLIQTGIPLYCYLDASLKEKGDELCKRYSNFKIPQYVTLDTSWIPENVIMPEIRNHEKDTKEYFAVQLMKAWCLADASKYVFHTHLAWIDAGICHIFKDQEKMTDYLHTIATSVWPDDILCPGAMWRDVVNNMYGEGKEYTMYTAICWRYLGGFLLGPAHLWPAFYEKQTACVNEHLPHLMWEVNYWAILDPFVWFQADHNIAMFEELLQFRITS